MHKKGYQIKLQNNKILPLKKSDFAGDISHTTRAFLKMLENIRNTPLQQFPLILKDLDNTDAAEIVFADKEEFESWLCDGFE